MRAAIVSLALVLFSLAVLPSENVAAQTFALYGQSFDAKAQGAEEEEMFWKSVSVCPFFVLEIGFLSALYHYDWDDGNWYPVRIEGGAVNTNTNWSAGSGVTDVQHYLGANCYSNWTYHFTGTPIQFGWIITASPGQCF